MMIESFLEKIKIELVEGGESRKELKTFPEITLSSFLLYTS